MPRSLLITTFFFVALLPSDAQDKKKPAAKTEPRVIFTIPLGAAPGKVTKLTLRGANLEYAKEVKVVDGLGSAKILSKGKAAVPDKNPDKVGDTQIEVELKLESNITGNTVSLVVVTPEGETKAHHLLVDSALPVADKEANEGFRTAQPISLPAVIDGTIGRQRDVDVFRLDGKKGQKLVAEVLASRFGSPLDAILMLHDAQGQQLAANDDFAKDHRDAKIELSLPADGSFYLSVIDAHDTGSNLHVYRLVVK